MRRLLVPIALAAAALAVAPAHGAALHAASKTYTVKVGDDFYTPTSRTIHVKDVVKWVWVGQDGKPGATVNQHTVTEENGKFTSKEKTSGTYSFRFRKAGKYTIRCADHPDVMVMKVRVKR